MGVAIQLDITSEQQLNCIQSAIKNVSISHISIWQQLFFFAPCFQRFDGGSLLHTYRAPCELYKDPFAIKAPAAAAGGSERDVTHG